MPFSTYKVCNNVLVVKVAEMSVLTGKSGFKLEWREFSLSLREGILISSQIHKLFLKMFLSFSLGL